MMKKNRKCLGCGSLLEKKNEMICMECASYVFKNKYLEEITRYDENGIKKAYPVRG